jgi:hypothetical protein
VILIPKLVFVPPPSRSTRALGRTEQVLKKNMSISDIQKYLAKTQEEYIQQLTKAAYDYLKAGLGIFHECRRLTDYTNSQAALGNLAISLELKLKAFIASKNLLFLFKSVPNEVRILLVCPETLPEEFNWKPFDIDFKSAKYQTIELDECLALLYIFIPGIRQQFQPHLKLISAARNTSVHSILPSFHKYELERAAYITLRVFELIDSQTNNWYYAYRKSENDNRFMSSFQEERIEQVKKAIEIAKEKAKSLSTKYNPIGISPTQWEIFIAPCPICENDAYFTGDTELGYSKDGEPYLDFLPYDLECEECGLKLNDIEELELAGISSRFDRGDDLEQYLEDEREDERS